MTPSSHIKESRTGAWAINAATGLGVLLFWWFQPLIADLLVPMFGGGPEIWTGCMLFFQVVILVGYLYAHVLTRLLTPRRALLTHAVALSSIAGLLLADPMGVVSPSVGGHPLSSTALFWHLSLEIGLPALALAATAPMFQFAYFAVTQKPPWRLYALANGAALLLLLGHPLIIEPVLSNSTQLSTWTGGFVLFSLLALWVGTQGPKHARGPSHLAPERPLHTLPWWLVGLLAGCASGLLLSTSEAMSRDVASIPLLWAWPLAVFLLSVIVTFDRPALYSRWWALGLMLLGTLALSTVRIFTEETPLMVSVVTHLVFLFAGCNLCHGELYRGRPASADVTSFNVAMAAGGALGGLGVGWLCPRLFDRLVELPLIMLLTFAVFALSAGREQSGRRVAAWTGIGVIVVATLVAGVGLFALSNTPTHAQRVVERARNMHGTLTLIERDARDGQAARRLLVDGNTTHGMQYLGLPGPPAPTLYYAPVTGIGEAIQRAQSARPEGAQIAIIGLGVGTIAAYARPTDTLTFLELNSAVEEMARARFDFLRHAPKATRVVLGDGRRLLHAEFAPQSLDLIVVDAFSSDAIPVHLLTREAIVLYQDRLRRGGLMAFHITNRYLDLTRVLLPMAQHLGLHAEVFSRDSFATWVVLSRIDGQRDAVPDVSVWTDDYAPIWSTLKW